MAYPVTLSAVAALSIAGAAIGVQLGRGTIADIDPLHFSEAPRERFFSDLVPGGYQTSDSATGRSEDFWAGSMNASGRPECFDCAAVTEVRGYGFAPDDQSQDGYVSEAALPEPVEHRNDEHAEVARYASFPVTQEEAERQSEARLQQHSAYSVLETRSASTETAKTDAVPVGM
jgi:hypothetical protein